MFWALRGCDFLRNNSWRSQSLIPAGAPTAARTGDGTQPTPITAIFQCISNPKVQLKPGIISICAEVKTNSSKSQALCSKFSTLPCTLSSSDLQGKYSSCPSNPSPIWPGNEDLMQPSPLPGLNLGLFGSSLLQEL